MRVKRFYEPMFRTDVIFIVDSNPIEIEKYCKEKLHFRSAEGYDKLAGSLTILDEKDKLGRLTRSYLIIVEDSKNFYTLLHETHHLAADIMETLQMPIRRDNDEIAAYLHEYWFRTLWRFMNNKVVKLERKK